uniref:Uncharacterized protein n=1 Tax=viral metagenome TaxID=1070528 RepID=A0A6C0BHC0_9ZZZZ
MESATFSEARVEYQKQMSNKLVTPLLDFFQKIYGKLKTESSEKLMFRFQNKCAEIPKWNQDIIVEETNKLIDASRCDYLEELMTALFIAHTKVMASVRINKGNKKLTITVPKLDHFLHRVFTEVAKSFWKAPFLFDTGLPAVERQKNLLQAEKMIEEAIFSAVRDMLPIKKILQEYISEPDFDEEVQEKVEEMLSSPTSVEVKPAEEKPVEVKPAEEKPVEVKPAEEKPVEVKPAEDKPVEVKPAEDKPISVNTKEEKIELEKVPEAKKESSIKIETEPSVQFSEKVSVFHETKAPEILDLVNPLNREEEDEYLEESDGPGDELLNIGQEVGGLDAGEVEDLEHPDQGIGDFEELS